MDTCSRWKRETVQTRNIRRRLDSFGGGGGCKKQLTWALAYFLSTFQHQAQKTAASRVLSRMVVAVVMVVVVVVVSY